MIEVRRYRPEDRAATAGVFFRAVREGAAGYYSEAQRIDWAKSPQPDYSIPDPRADQVTWVSESAGQITGFFAMTPEGHLDMAFVLPDVMGKGHAAALYDSMLQHVRAQGLRQLTVHASEYSRRFLTRRGWVLDRVEEIVSDAGVAYDRNYMSLTVPA